MVNKNQIKSKSGRGVTWAETVRDVLIASIDKGQLLPLGLLFISVLVVWKMPGDEIRNLFSEILGTIRDGSGIGWILFVVVAVGWYFHNRVVRREFRLEYERIGREKSALQSQNAGVVFESSDK